MPICFDTDPIHRSVDKFNFSGSKVIMSMSGLNPFKWLLLLTFQLNLNTVKSSNLTVVIQLDTNPESLHWELRNYETGALLLNGSGIKADINETIVSSINISTTNDECYQLNILVNLSSSNGVRRLLANRVDYRFPNENSENAGYFGWYKVLLDDVVITHGKQSARIQSTENGLDSNYFKFCSDFFSFVNNGDTDNSTLLTLNTKNFIGEITFGYGYGNRYRYDSLYATNYTVPKNLARKRISTSFYISDGCYSSLFNSFDNTGDDFEISLTMKLANGDFITVLNTSSMVVFDDDSYILIRFCTNGTYDELEFAYCNNSNELAYTFLAEVDRFAREIGYSLTDVDENKVIHDPGRGNISKPLGSIVTETACLDGDHCYFVHITDGYGDGMFHWKDDYGTWQVYLNDDVITIGEQAENSEYVNMYFCGQLFAGGRNNVTVIVYFDGYDELYQGTYIDTYYNYYNRIGPSVAYNGTRIEIVNNTNGETLYLNNFVLPKFLVEYRYLGMYNGRNASIQSLNIVDGCYSISSSKTDIGILVNGEYYESDSNGLIDEFCVEHTTTSFPSSLPTAIPVAEEQC